MLQGLGKCWWDVSDRSMEVKCSRCLLLSRNTCSTSDGIVLSGHSYLQNNALQSEEWFSLWQPSQPLSNLSVSGGGVPVSFRSHTICWISVEDLCCSTEVEHLRSNHEVVGLIPSIVQLTLYKICIQTNQQKIQKITQNVYCKKKYKYPWFWAEDSNISHTILLHVLKNWKISIPTS